MFRKKTKTEPFQASIGGEIIDTELNVDITSGTWISVRNHCLNRIDYLRGLNDNDQLTEKETAVIRGRIKELKELMDLPKPKPEMYVSEDII